VADASFAQGSLTGEIVMGIDLKRRRLIDCAAFAAAACVVALTSVPAADAANFFAGKTVTIIVPYGPGGGYDKWARLVAPYFKKDLGAAEVKVENRPGGGGLVGADMVYNSKPDGLTIGDTNAGGDVFAEMAKDPGVQFKTRKMNWLGRPDNDPHVIAVHPDSPYKTFDDIVALKGGKTVLKCLASGKGSGDYNATVIAMNAFQVPFHMVAAFKGSHAEKATFVTGAGDTLSLSASDVMELGPGEERIVVLIARAADTRVPGVPSVVAEANKHHLSTQKIDALTSLVDVMSMGHAFVVPPGVPIERLKALRAAFAQTLHDKSFLAKAEKAGLWTGYEGPDELAHAARLAFEHKDLFTELLKTD
jgi:putative tricarboxylic transport membrane protein